MKVIVSAKAFWMLMEKQREHPDEEGNYELVVEGNKLHFNGISELDVEVREGGRVELNKKQFKSLRKVVRALDDQPLVLFTDSSTHLQITNLWF